MVATYHPPLCVLYLTGCPVVVRADYGTENCVVAKIQIAFRMNHLDSLSGQRSFFMAHQLLIVYVASLYPCTHI